MLTVLRDKLTGGDLLRQGHGFWSWSVVQFFTQQLAQPAQSSWGERGYHEYWLNDTNEWIYPRLTLAAERMIALASRAVEPPPLEARALTQAARELLLAQASDWAFIMRTKTTVDYAVRRTRTHLARFWRLADEIERGEIDEAWLSHVEHVDSCFQHLDYRVYARRH